MPLYENPNDYMDSPKKDSKTRQSSDRFSEECDFCSLLRRRFFRESVTLYIDCKCCTEENTISGYVTCYSFEEGVVKLFSSPVGGTVTGVACCSDIYAIETPLPTSRAARPAEASDDPDESSL